MGLRSIVPAPPLAAHIAQLWDCDVAPEPFRLERMLPAPGASLVINLYEDEMRIYDDADGFRCVRSSAATLEGPRSRRFVIDTAEQVRVMGVEFRAGGVAAFIREPIDRLADRHVDLDVLFGSGVRSLRESLLDARDAAHRLARLEAWLHARLIDAARDPAIDHALARFAVVPQLLSIETVARDCGFSPRRFGALFRERIGLSPKRYCRVRRFQSVIASVHAQRRVEWCRVASDCGFADQSHLVHEFREFSGLTPTAYLAQRGPYPNHVPI
jgi:AraC-like DNA-binding protein